MSVEGTYAGIKIILGFFGLLYGISAESSSRTALLPATKDGLQDVKEGYAGTSVARLMLRLPRRTSVKRNRCRMASLCICHRGQRKSIQECGPQSGICNTSGDSWNKTFPDSAMI